MRKFAFLSLLISFYIKPIVLSDVFKEDKILGKKRRNVYDRIMKEKQN